MQQRVLGGGQLGANRIAIERVSLATRTVGSQSCKNPRCVRPPRDVAPGDTQTAVVITALHHGLRAAGALANVATIGHVSCKNRSWYGAPKAATLAAALGRCHWITVDDKLYCQRGCEVTFAIKKLARHHRRR